jgi:hypothetical protein
VVHGRDPVEALQQDADRGWQAQHRRASSTERTASRVGGSKPPVTRIIGPEGSTISIGVFSAGVGSTQQTADLGGTFEWGWRAGALEHREHAIVKIA